MYIRFDNILNLKNSGYLNNEYRIMAVASHFTGISDISGRLLLQPAACLVVLNKFRLAEFIIQVTGIYSIPQIVFARHFPPLWIVFLDLKYHKDQSRL